MTVPPNLDADRQWFPVSSAQQRVWLMDRLSPEPFAAIIPVTLRLSAEVDAAALAAALDEITRRHEVLRARFAVRDGVLQQSIQPQGSVRMAVVDLRDLPAREREAGARRRVAVEARRPFELTTDAPIRAMLFRLDSTDHLLFVALHHIVADGWSVGVLVRELRAIYPAMVRGLRSPLPEPRLQYVDYAVWESQHLGDVLDNELRYWRRELADLPPLALNRAVPAATGSTGQVSISVPAELSERLTALGRRQGTTMFMTLLAGFQALLHRVSGQDDFAVGTVIANRTRTETEDLIGCFVNTLVIRCAVGPNDTFLELLRRTRETTLSAYAHQEMPFERLVEELHPQREAGRNPLVQVLFTFHNNPPVTQQFHDRDSVRRSAGEPSDIGRGTANFDLTVDMWATPDGLRGRWEFRPDLFEAADVERLTGQFIRFLGLLTAEPDLVIARAPLVGPRERLDLLDRASGAARRYPGEPVHRTIIDRADRWPARIAASSDTETLSYADIAGRSAQLTRVLRRCSVSAGEVIGICLHRSPSWGIAVLGVLQTGGAFLPLDPGDPPARRADLLKDAGVRIVVTDSTLADQLDVGGVELIRIDDVDRSPDPAPRPPDDGSVPPPDRPAYLIYTSGTTGAPKGAMISHRALANHCHAVAERYGLDPAVRGLQLAPMGFDVAIEEVLPVWLTGGSVHFPSQTGPLSAAELHRCVDLHRITLLNLPASYWHEWVDHLQRTAGPVPASVRLVVCGSERVSTEKLRRWQDLAGEVRWINAYGVTESTITATTYEPPRRLPDDFPDTVPIGRPLANVAAYVLDNAGQPVPDGVAGELFLGGDGIALGYLGRPDLTATQFISTAIDPGTELRLYRTGDLVLRDPRGDLQFLGRRDDQVKIRGHRVELGEIEAALLRHPEVAAAAVTVSSKTAPGTGGQRPIAYVVPGNGTAPDSVNLIAHLRGLLPAFMVPNTFVELPSLPRSAHGKIDRAALPAPRLAPAHKVGPRTELEQRLAEIWATVLGLADVGVTDNFFDLGGHSLLAMRLVSRAHTALGIDIPLRTVFDAPTVADLASALEKYPAAGGVEGASSIAPPSPPTPSRPGSGIVVDDLTDAEVDALLTELLEENP